MSVIFKVHHRCTLTVGVKKNCMIFIEIIIVTFQDFPIKQKQNAGQQIKWTDKDHIQVDHHTIDCAQETKQQCVMSQTPCNPPEDGTVF